MATKTQEPEEAPAQQIDDDVILDLTVLAPRRKRIRCPLPGGGDDLFDLRSMKDFGIAEQQQLTADGKEFDELWNSAEKLNSTQRKRLKIVLDAQIEKVLDAPQEVKNALDDMQKSQIVLAFTLAPLVDATAREQAEQEARESSTSES